MKPLLFEVYHYASVVTYYQYLAAVHLRSRKTKNVKIKCTIVMENCVNIPLNPVKEFRIEDSILR